MPTTNIEMAMFVSNDTLSCVQLTEAQPWYLPKAHAFEWNANPQEGEGLFEKPPPD